MKRIISLLALGIALAACGPMDDVAESTVSLSTNVRTDACSDANYTRTMPGYCSRTATGVNFALTLDSTCRVVALSPSTIPSDARQILVKNTIVVNSNNAIALRGVIVTFHTDAGCTVAQSWGPSVFIREFVATVANTTLVQAEQGASPMVLVNEAGVLGVRYIGQRSGAGTLSTANLGILGYYD